MGKFELRDYRNSINLQGHSLGEAFIGVLAFKDQKPIPIILPLRFPNFDKMRKGNVFFFVKGYDERYYTGLQVTRDPGVWVVYTGFILMIIGCFITFFMSHQRVCVEVTESGQNSKVMVAGISEKNKLGMQKKITRIWNNLVESSQGE